MSVPNHDEQRRARRAAVRLVLLALLGLTSLAVCNRYAAARAQDQGLKAWYQAETLFAKDKQGGVDAYAGAGTFLVFDNKGIPSFIAFASKNAQGEGIFQKEYGVDDAGRPLNKGRLIYRGQAMNYAAIGSNMVYFYHLKYLELTTVGDDASGYRAYAVRAFASDNKLESSNGGPSSYSSYKLPEGGELVIDKGQIKFGETCVRPNYDLTGKVVAPQAKP